MAALNRETAPPSYSAAGGGSAPPSYDSIFGKIKNTKQESSNPLEFFKKLFAILCGGIACTIVAILVLGIPIAMIVIGAIYKNDCRAQELIPIYLIVGGSVGLARNLICVKKTNDEQDGEKSDPGAILDVFLFAWLIAGSVWVYHIWQPEYKHNSLDDSNYCNETVYKFAFGIITASWSLMGLICCCGCCIGISVMGSD